LGDLYAEKQQTQIKAGDGNRVLGRTLPKGWTAEQYGDQQIGPEQFIWNGQDSIIFAKNVRDASTFEYSKGVLDRAQYSRRPLIHILQTFILEFTRSFSET
jgi:hypothetical protein